MIILEDGNFAKGFDYVYSLKDSDVKEHRGHLFGHEGLQPIWTIGQWYSRYPIADLTPKTLANGSIGYLNNGLEISMLQENNQNLLTLFLKGKAEYEGIEIKQGQGWPHILIMQNFKKRNLPKICKMNSLTINYNARLLECTNYMGNLYIPERFCAQAVSYFSIINRNPHSESYNQFFWFGMPIYDNRHVIPPAYRAKDGGDPKAEKKGTGMYIYTIDGKKLWDSPVGDGNWHHTKRDVLPEIIDGFYDSKKSGYLADANFEDMELSSYNLGWEVVGVFDASIQLKEIFAECK